ncbi:hypothetical protein Trydic_g20696 [Trypoxylus dichotomus]
MGKHKKSKKEKKSKIHKRKRLSSSSSSSSAEWIEKSEAVSSSSQTKQEREEWMSMSSSFNTTSVSDKRIERENKRRLEKEQNQYNPTENIREINPYWKNGGIGLPSFKKPTDNNFEYKRKTDAFNWKKKNTEKLDCRNYCEDKTSKTQDINIEDKVSDKDLNKLAAKLMKAELMGNADLVTELKKKLDEAKKVPGASSSGEEVLLTITDVHGISRPFKSNYEDGEGSRSSRKKQKVETHLGQERIRYFADDDKYSLKQMFEAEKYANVTEQNKEFVKIISKAKTDLDDFFTDEIRKDVKNNKKDIDKAVNAHMQLSKRLDNCNYCLQSETMRKHLMVSMGETVFLSLPAFEPITEGHCLLIPLRHSSCVTQLDENEWYELLTFRKSLCSMFDSIDKEVIFFETALKFYKHPHMILHCVPIPREQGEMAPIYFKKAIDESETEWSVNKKLVSLSGRDVRKAIPKGLPYFSVSFGMIEGYAHVIEDERMFPQNFAQEIIGGMLDLDHSKWRKPKKQSFEQQSEQAQNFAKLWCNYDCTKN